MNRWIVRERERGEGIEHRERGTWNKRELKEQRERERERERERASERERECGSRERLQGRGGRKELRSFTVSLVVASQAAKVPNPTHVHHRVSWLFGLKRNVVVKDSQSYSFPCSPHDSASKQVFSRRVYAYLLQGVSLSVSLTLSLSL